MYIYLFVYVFLFLVAGAAMVAASVGLAVARGPRLLLLSLSIIAVLVYVYIYIYIYFLNITYNSVFFLKGSRRHNHISKLYYHNIITIHTIIIICIHIIHHVFLLTQFDNNDLDI